MYLGEEEGRRDGTEEERRCFVRERGNIEANACDLGVGMESVKEGRGDRDEMMRERMSNRES